MSGTIDDQYLEWLYAQVAAVRNRNPARSYWKLFRQLYSKEFIWLVPNDDNRVEDGRNLRIEFLAEQGSDQAPSEWLELGCSVLEMLIALARRIEFQTDTEAVEWFWTFLQNLSLSHFNDNFYNQYSESEIDDILDSLIFRLYERDGRGGLFPISDPSCVDQRKIEIWDQMSIYLIENQLF